MGGKKTKPNLASLKKAGDTALENENFEVARQLYTQALSIDPNNAELYKCLGRVYHDQGQLEAAEEFYFKAIAKDNNYWAAHHNLGVIFQTRKDFERALDYYKKAAELNPDQVLSYIYLSRTFRELKQSILANYYFIKAFELDSTDSLVLYDYACLLIDKNAYEPSIKILSQILPNTPDQNLPGVYHRLAYACHQLPHERIQAIEYYHCYVDRTKKKAGKRWAYHQLVELYVLEKQYEKAIDCCVHAAENLEEDVDEFDWLNEFACRFSFWTMTPLLGFGIKRLLEYAIAHPSSSLVHYFLAFCFNTAKQYEKAVKHAKISIRLDPLHPRAYYQLACAYCHMACSRNGQYEDCIATILKIIELDPLDNYQVYEWLARIYKYQGQYNKARLAERKAERFKNIGGITLNKTIEPREGEFI